MPKKSREQKMLADIRRRVRTERLEPAPAIVSPSAQRASTFRFTSPVRIEQQERAAAGGTTELTAIKKDLMKTMILATVAIAAELVLYWFERR